MAIFDRNLLHGISAHAQNGGISMFYPQSAVIVLSNPDVKLWRCDNFSSILAVFSKQHARQRPRCRKFWHYNVASGWTTTVSYKKGHFDYWRAFSVFVIITGKSYHIRPTILGVFVTTALKAHQTLWALYYDRVTMFY